MVGNLGTVGVEVFFAAIVRGMLSKKFTSSTLSQTVTKDLMSRAWRRKPIVSK